MELPSLNCITKFTGKFNSSPVCHLYTKSNGTQGGHWRQYRRGNVTKQGLHNLALAGQ